MRFQMLLSISTLKSARQSSPLYWYFLFYSPSSAKGHQREGGSREPPHPHVQRGRVRSRMRLQARRTHQGGRRQPRRHPHQQRGHRVRPNAARHPRHHDREDLQSEHYVPLLGKTARASSANLLINPLLFQTVKAFLPEMIRKRKGHIVTVGSLTGMLGTYKCTDYSATKHATIGFHESLLTELKVKRFQSEF